MALNQRTVNAARFLRRSVLTGLLIVISVGGLLAIEQQQQRSERVSHHSETSTVSGRNVAQVQVRLARGRVTVTPSNSHDVTVRVSQRSTTTDARVVNARISETTTGLRIVAVHPTPLPDFTHESIHIDEELGDFWHYDVTVDIELEVPPQIAVHARTMRGAVTVAGLNGDVDVATNDGEIQLRNLSGNVTAAALGNLDIEFPAQFTKLPTVRLTTYGGDLKIRIPSGQRVQTNDGQATFLFREPVELLRTDGAMTRELSLSIGEYGVSLEVGVTNGRLVILPTTQ